MHSTSGGEEKYPHFALDPNMTEEDWAALHSYLDRLREIQKEKE